MSKSHKKFIPFNDRYPIVDNIENEENYKIKEITHMSNKISEYSVLFWHRLLRINYGKPSFATYEPIEKISETVNVMGIDWIYYLKLESGIIAEIRPIDKRTLMKISLIIPNHSKLSISTFNNYGKKFSNNLLSEAKRLKNQIILKEEEFEKGLGITLFIVDNLYLSNYHSAMFAQEQSIYLEEELRQMNLKYDARDEAFLGDVDKMNFIDHAQMIKGSYFLSSILYYYNSLEAFMNFFFSAFLRSEIRNPKIGIKRRLNLDLKIQLAPSLCRGFASKSMNFKRGTLYNFRKLRSYRNEIIHADMESSAKRGLRNEDGFLYSYEIEKDYKDTFPSKKLNLTIDHVKLSKKIVDNVIEEIVNKLSPKYKSILTETILNSSALMFYKDAEGKVKFAPLDTKIGDL